MGDSWSDALQAQARGDIQGAYAMCEQILDADPFHVGAVHLLGVLAMGVGEFEQALVFFDQALRLSPQDPSALTNRGSALFRMGQLQQALMAYRQSVEADPEFAQGWYNLGNALKASGQMEEACDCFERCVNVAPDFQAAHYNWGNALHEMGQFAAAVPHFDRAVELDPCDGEARKNRGFARLMLGDWIGGWVDYEWRWTTPPLVSERRVFSCPRWTGGEHLDGRSIFVYAEQGLGDTIQFCRLLRVLKQRGARVIFEAQAALLPLLEGLDGLDEGDSLLSPGSITPATDFEIPLMSLPGALGLTSTTVPASIPYVRARPEARVRWKSALSTTDFRIGVCWKSSAKGAEFGRSIPPAAFLPVAQIEGVRLFSLQKFTVDDTEEAMVASLRIHNFGAEFDANAPFVDTAAVMTLLDLVITTDTSIAHLAGALGVPVWVALTKVADWRWGAEGDTTPWYPSMRLFRQASKGDWGPVFDEMAQAARPLVSAHR